MTLALLRRAFEPAKITVIAGCPEAELLATQIRSGSYRGTLTVLPGVDALPALAPSDLLIASVAVAEQVLAAAAGRDCAGLLVPDGEAADGERLRSAADPSGMRLIGPDSLGLAAPRLGLNATAVPVQLAAGSVALIAQSNSVAAGILAWAARRGIGLSGVVILGGSADVDIADALDHFTADPSTRTILLTIDAVTDAPRFLSSARAAARLKPVLVLKPPRLEPPWPALTHSALIVTSDAAHDAALHRAGLLRVDDLDELFAAAETLGRARAADSGRLAIVSNGDGLAALAAARMRQAAGTEQRLLEPEIVRTAQDYREAVARLLARNDVDAVLALNAPLAPDDSGDCARAVAEAYAAPAFRKPVLAVWVGGGEEISRFFASAGIPSFATEQAAIVGFQHLTRHARLLKELMATPPALDESDQPDIDAATALVDRAIAQGRAWLEPDEVTQLLVLFRIPTLGLVIAADATAAAEAARAQFAAGRTVALKIVSPDVAHKSDVGGVELELANEQAVRDAADRMAERLRQLRPEARLAGFLVQPMAHRAKARELIAGFSVDLCFGPVIVFGRGGTAAELIADTQVALPPLDLASAESLIARTRVSRILAAYRDVPAADRRAIAEVLVAVGNIASALPQIRAMDLNPILADAGGVVAVDARVVLEPDPARRRRPAIRPYPNSWTRRLALGERRFFIRPMKPEDELLIGAMLARVTAEDLRLRFFAPLKTFSHAFLARLTQLDYAREIAFIAIEEDSGEAAGAVRLHAAPGHAEAEYAILLRSDLKGLGLGRALMELIIDWAKAEKVQRVHSQVLAENGPMLALCRDLGFEITADPDDISTKHVALNLHALGSSRPAEP
ncbi:MAG TPA: GNAT family N-acetyltransferase [Bosea sp. (in: a-proteobacteria)]|jgi:acetyltransferase|uniref:bifunctional acetate--CoA ligase family protein/GNAT family N-acetyltransferase n=1 Tax=Bosea sp. (in: a-proteobacteria) TaxID=1871050 RepID=UPI002E13CD70|nr:GNAT family N-acetyltransferase [Bosea sp. (in: a-proteobacteria)]